MTTTAVATTQPTDIGGLLDLNRDAIRQALPKTIKADRFLRVCMNAIARNPDLQKCTASSLYAGIMQSAQLGLEIGLMNQAHLVPYWNSEKRGFEAQFQIGYLGLRDLAERYGDVVDGDAQKVHEKDVFDYGQGSAPFITHIPSKDQHRGEVVHYYCWAQPKDGKLKVAVMSKAEVEAHRDRFVRKKKDGAFGPAWTTTFDAMALKTVIRHCYKLLARSPELREAIALDEMQEIHIPQNLGLELDQAQKAVAMADNTARLAAMQQNPESEPVQGDGLEPQRAIPQQVQDAPAPSYKDARGCAPSLTGLSPEDAIRRGRDEDALAPTAPPDPVQEVFDDPSIPWKAKITTAHDAKAVNVMYASVPEELKQDCFAVYSDKLKTFNRK